MVGQLIRDVRHNTKLSLDQVIVDAKQIFDNSLSVQRSSVAVAGRSHGLARTRREEFIIPAVEGLYGLPREFGGQVVTADIHQAVYYRHIAQDPDHAEI